MEDKKKDVMEYIAGHFPGAALKYEMKCISKPKFRTDFKIFVSVCNFLRETYQELLTYYVPPSNETKWSKMFGLIESAKESLEIEDYSIKQTSLEQVFLAMAKL